jgi:hypothetical protein
VISTWQSRHPTLTSDFVQLGSSDQRVSGLQEFLTLLFKIKRASMRFRKSMSHTEPILALSAGEVRQFQLGRATNAYGFTGLFRNVIKMETRWLSHRYS